MLPEKNIKALKVLHKLFSENTITWKLTGSSNLALQGVSVDAKDVDIFVKNNEIDKVQKLLDEYTIDSIKYSQTEKFRSFFGRFSIENCLVEVMCNLEIFKDGTWLKSSPFEDLPVFIKLDDSDIPCITLKMEYEGCMRLGRLEKAEKIKHVL